MSTMNKVLKWIGIAEEDEEELYAVSKVFEELLEDVDIEM